MQPLYCIVFSCIALRIVTVSLCLTATIPHRLPLLSLHRLLSCLPPPSLLSPTACPIVAHRLPLLPASHVISPRCNRHVTRIYSSRFLFLSVSDPSCYSVSLFLQLVVAHLSPFLPQAHCTILPCPVASLVPTTTLPILLIVPSHLDRHVVRSLPGLYRSCSLRPTGIGPLRSSIV